MRKQHLITEASRTRARQERIIGKFLVQKSLLSGFGVDRHLVEKGLAAKYDDMNEWIECEA
jgi:hypothetical protein